MRKTALAFALSLLLPAVGCVTADEALKVHQSGMLVHEDPDGLGFLADGTPMLYDTPIALPRLSERVHYGLSVVDTTPLPAAWRLDTAPEGGVVVAAVHGGSALAHAGVRPLDRIEKVSGEDVTGVEDLRQRLERRRLRLTVRKPDGRRREVEVRRSREGVESSSTVKLLSLVSWANGNAGSGHKVGPGGILWNSRDVVFTSTGRTVHREEFGCLFDLFATRSEVDLETGEERSCVRVLWLFEFGDDPVAPPRDEEEDA